MYDSKVCFLFVICQIVMNVETGSKSYVEILLSISSLYSYCNMFSMTTTLTDQLWGQVLRKFCFRTDQSLFLPVLECLKKVVAFKFRTEVEQSF